MHPLRSSLLAQGAYHLSTGASPFVARRPFEAVVASLAVGSAIGIAGIGDAYVGRGRIAPT